MPNYVVTYDIQDDDTRDLFKTLLKDELNLNEEDGNQSTFFGFYRYNLNSFVEKIKRLMQQKGIQTLERDDAVTIYSPKKRINGPDIERYVMKEKGRYIDRFE